MKDQIDLRELLIQFSLNISDEYCLQDYIVNVYTLKVLHWYRERDHRPWYVDYALCLAEIKYDDKKEYVLGLMARNPNDAQSRWDRAVIIDGGINSYWLYFFHNFPTIEDGYKHISKFTKLPRSDWERYDSMCSSD